MKSIPVRLDVLVAIALSLVVLMQGQSWLSLIWGFGLHRMTVSRWDAFVRRMPGFLPVPFGKKLLCLAGMLLAAGVANILSTTAGVFSAHQAQSASFLAMACACAVLFGGAFVVSRFVNVTWPNAR